MSKGHFSQAGNKITGTLNNHGFSVNGNNFHISGGNVIFRDRGESKEEECRRALFLTNPLDDRGGISTSKPRLVAKVCQWIHDHAHFKSWKDSGTYSQLLWISGGSGMGKTMLSLFLLRELEASPEHSQNSIILFYFCDGRNDSRNNAVSVLRGLIFLLLKARPGLINLLLSDYDIQKEALFSQSQTSLEALWRIFETMIKDPSTGRVFCIIDGLDECKEDLLWQLLRKVTNFYEDEKERQELCQSRNLNPVFQSPNISLKMILVSRGAPKCLPEALAQFPRVQLGLMTKREAKPTARKAPKLSCIAREVLRQRTLDKNTNSAAPNTAAPELKPEPGQEQVQKPANVQPTLAPLALTQHTLAKPASTTQAALAQFTPTPPTLTQVPPALDPNVPAYVQLPTEGKAFTAEPSQTEYVFDEILEEEEEETIEEDTGGEEIGQNQSLLLYIEAKVADLSAERAYPEPLRSSVTTGLQNRGDGTFLWVDLAIEEVKRYESQHIEKVLQHLPPSLNEMYCRTLQRIPPHLVGLVVAILRWVVAARRPLFLDELAVALGLMNFNAFNIIDMTRQGIAACGTMMTIHEDNAVHITHTSVKDLLIARPEPLWSDPGLFRFHVNVEEADGEIASLCLHYLEQGCLKDGPISPTDNPDRYKQRAIQYLLLPYAAQFWPDHLRSASRPQINLSSSFFMRKSNIRKNWWLTYYSATTGKTKLLAPRNFNILHMAAYLNMPYIAEQLLQRGELRSRLDDRDSHGASPLCYAAEMGNMAMFVFLLQQGAKQDAVGETIFELACRKGQGEIAEYLLNLGYNVNAKARYFTTMEAVGLATKWLPGVLNEGIQLDGDKWKLMVRDTGDGGTALHNACLFGHVSVVKMLLRKNANVHATTTKRWTALHSAAWTGQIECVKLLLEKGANAFEVTEFGWVPFHCAASRGKTPVVRLFLELGVPVDTLTMKQKSALHLAAYSGNAATVRLLLEHGAALDAQSHKGETVLHLATRNAKPEVVELLLSFGANKLIMNKDGFSAADTIKMIKGGGTKEQKEVLRILETFGIPGYVPWKPKQDPNAAAAATTVQAPNQGTTSQSEHMQRASTMPGFSSVQPVLPTTYPYTAQPQPQPAFQANLYFGVHQSTYAPEKTGFQDPTSFQGGSTVPMSPLPGHPTPQRTQSTPTGPLNQQYTADSYPPPPPYTPSPNVQADAQSRSFPEKEGHASLPSIYLLPSLNIQQPPPIPNASRPTPNPILTQFNPPNMATASQPTAQVPPQQTPATPQLIIPQHTQPATFASPPPVPASPVPPPSPQLYASVSLASDMPQNRPAIYTASTYGPPATIHNNPPPQGQPPLQVYPPQQANGVPQQFQPSPTHQRSLSNASMQTYEPQFSHMSLSPSPSTASTYSAQQEWSAPPISQPYNPNANRQYPGQPVQQHSTSQQYPNSPVYPHPAQQYAGQPYLNPQGGFLSVSFTPRGFGGPHGGVGAGLQFAPPPTAEAPEFQKKKSFRNLGGFLQ